MTQDEIIEMVKIAEDKVIANPNLDWKIEFAKLVAAKERKACAKACAELGEWSCVHAIESRGEA